MMPESVRPYVFEGFCDQCRKRLKMEVTVEKQKIVLEVVKCEKHPDDSFFLLPTDRQDIIYTNLTTSSTICFSHRPDLI